MKVYRRKQIVVLSLVLMIVVAGYLQYSYKKSSTADNREQGRLGEAVYVDSHSSHDELADTEAGKDKEAGKSISASKEANDYFAQARLDREVSRSKDVDILKGISSDENADKEIKAEAFEKMMKIVDNSQMESKIETLIKEKGFEDVIALFAEDGSIDIIVKSPGLNSAQAAQIADVVMRHTKLTMDKIHINTIY